MSKSKQTASGGLSFAGVLTLIFITLKLTHFIDWSWWWVLAPLWLPMAVIIAALVLYIVVAVIWKLATEGSKAK